jgi:heavy metal response regulator
MRVLLVEDEQNVATFLKKGLEEEFYTVDVADNGRDGFEMGASREYDCIILDVMLPEISGIEICRKLRNANVKTPILMLTALDSVGSKVEGLESGADDYLTKPFAFSELLARIRALLRRAPDSVSELTLNDLRMDLLSRRVFRGEQEIILTQKGFAILEYFLRNRGRVLSRTQIIENIWGYNFDPNTNVVDVHIKFLREKIDKGFKQKLIHTVRGSGYVLKVEDENQDI